MNKHPTTDLIFPDPFEAGEDGLLCYGGYLDVGSLYAAYSIGVFPWPQEGLPLLWFFPWHRGVLHFSDLHLSRSFKKFYKKHPFKITHNQNFAGVIRACQKQKRSGQQGTWITEEIVQAYIEFHQAGYAHSFEAWKDEQLVGGIYGVLVDRVFSAESMFYIESGASKVCFYEMVKWLKAQGHNWMDVQMITPITANFGCREVDRQEFGKLLRTTRR